MSRDPQIRQIAAALIREGDTILLVQQQGPDDSLPTWALPGGVAESGEFLSEALAREVREETGLEILDAGRLIYFVQVVDPEDGSQSQAFVFEVEKWAGQLQASDLDRYVKEAHFLTLDEAILKLDQLPWRSMREPLLAYLQGQSSPGAAWFYRRESGGSEALSPSAYRKTSTA